MKIGIVGCGYVADFYAHTLSLHPELILAGVFDKVPERSKRFSSYYSVPIYDTLDGLLQDKEIEIVLNLTNPRSHYEVSLAVLHGGKHVYSEKPLCMNMDQARQLVDLAASKRLQISTAPCSLLGEAAQTLWKLLREEAIGKVYLVYAEMDDGMVTSHYKNFSLSASGAPWPYKDEFEIGCTLEHAGYCLSWLAAFFGPAVSVTAFGSTQIADKLPGETLDLDSPDFSVACIQFKSGVVARLTCSIIAPRDHCLKIIGDNGILYTDEVWNYYSPVYIQKLIRFQNKLLNRIFNRIFNNPAIIRQKLLKSNLPKSPAKGPQMDFCRGVAEMAASIRENRPNRLSAQFSLHVTEIMLAIHNARELGSTYQMTTTFESIEPVSWAQP